MVIPAAPMWVPADPVLVPADPMLIPAAPVLVPAEPVVVPADPMLVPAEPVFVPAEPLFVPAAPMPELAPLPEFMFEPAAPPPVPAAGGAVQTPLLQVAPAAQGVPHLPQLSGSELRSAQTPVQSVEPAAHSHAPNLQLSVLHVCVPSPPLQAWVEPALQVPSPAQGPNAPQVPVLVSQVRICVPQLPQVCVAEPGVHGMLTPVHGPHAHVAALQLCVPLLFAPHTCICVPLQTPWFVQAPNALQVPVLVSHVRVCVPQLPHA
jgi:hypothetical protein